jgi:hypothetical protein
MTIVFEDFSDNTAPPGHVTFSVLDQEHRGHSVGIASNEYTGAVRATKAGLSDIPSADAFKGAMEIIRRSAVCSGDQCQCEDEGLLYAFISVLLKHPDKRTSKPLMAKIRSGLRNVGSAHVILVMPPDGPSAWHVPMPPVTPRCSNSE